MDATTTPQASQRPAWRPVKANVVHLRPAFEADAPRIARLAKRGTAVCFPGTGGERALARFQAGRQPATLAVSENEEVLGIAWLELAPLQPAAIGVVVLPRYRRAGGVSALVHALASEARRHGHREVTTMLAPGLPDPLGELRAAGLRVISAFTTGGISDVRLAIE